MASLTRDKNGTMRILFVGADGTRRAIRLGRLPAKVAESIKTRVASLASFSHSKLPWDTDLAAWVGKLEGVHYGKLAAVGLVPPRDPAPSSQPVTLGEFVEQYIAGRGDTKPNTVKNFKQSKRYLLEYFGANRPLGSITPGDADDFRRHLAAKLADNTVRRQCGRAKQFFRAAVRKRLISENPFGNMKGCAVRANSSRFHYVTRKEIGLVLEACPDAKKAKSLIG